MRCMRDRMVPVFLATVGLLASWCNAQQIRGYVVDTPGCSVRVYRQSTWASDEVRTVSDGRGYWEVDCDKFYESLNPGNSFCVEYGWNIGKPVNLSWHRGRDSEEILPDLHLDQFTVCIKDVMDSSPIAGDLKLHYHLIPSAGQGLRPVVVDTGRTQDAFFDIHLPLPKYRVFPTSLLYLKLFKTFGPANESVAYTERSYDLYPHLNTQVLEEEVGFPEQRVARQDQDHTGTMPTTERAEAERHTAPSRLIAAPLSNRDRSAGVLFNALGQRVPKGASPRLRSGTYFLVTEGPPMVRKYVVSR